MDKEIKGTMPDFSSNNGIAVWKHVDKNGNEYVSVCILGSININCFKPLPKKEGQKTL